jgi:uncharacterized protein YndB with AHSA1/START domain
MLMERDPVVTVSQRFDEPPEVVFDAWLDPKVARRWMFTTGDDTNVRCDIDARVGGWFIIVDRRPDGDVEHAGQFLQIDRPRHLAFNFNLPALNGDFDRVTVDIHPAHGGCELVLTHEMKPKWAAYKARTEAGWSRMLDQLAKIVRGGLTKGGSEGPPV